MAHGAHNGGENVGNELIDYFQRSRAQKAYNIDLLEQKYRRIEEQGLDTGIEIDFVNNITYAPKNMSKRAVCAKINKYGKKEFGLAKISAPCNSLEVFGKGYAKRAKECRQLDSDFNATFKMKFPKWQPYEPRKRRTVKRTIRETVKELVFDNPLDYLHYIMKIKGLPAHIFERRGVLPLPMVAGDCSKSRESSPVRNSLAALKVPALPSLMVASSEDCSRSRECSPVRKSLAPGNACTLPNLMISKKDCSRSRECSPNRSFDAVTKLNHIRKVPPCNSDHAANVNTCHRVDSNTDPVETSTRMANSDTTSFTPPHVAEKTSMVAMPIRKEAALSSKAPSISSGLSCASHSLVTVSNKLTKKKETTPKICKAPASSPKTTLPLMPSASTQVDHASSTPRAPATTGRRQRKRPAPNTQPKASQLGSDPEVTPTTLKSALKSASRREKKQTTAKRKNVVTPASRGNNTEKANGPPPATASARSSSRTPATPTAVRRRQRKPSSQNSEPKRSKLRAQLEVTPALSKTVPRAASRCGNSTAKRKKGNSTPIIRSDAVCNTPTIDGEASSRLKLDSAQYVSLLSPTGISGRTRSCSAAASRSRSTGKKAKKLRGRIIKNARNDSISPSSNNALPNNHSSPISSEVIGKSSLRSRMEAGNTPQSLVTTPIAKSDLATATSAMDKTSVHRSGKGRKRNRLSKLTATPAALCDTNSLLTNSKNRKRRRKASSKSTPSQSSPPVATPTSNNASALIKQDEVRDKNCSSTMATTSSTTRKRRSDGSDPVDTSFLPSDMPSGLWDESVQTIVKSYEESFPAISKKMTILGFDAQEFRRHFCDSSQTTLSSFVNFTREYQDFCGENYLDNGLKEDRRAMAAAKSRNRVLKDGYFA